MSRAALRRTAVVTSLIATIAGAGVAAAPSASAAPAFSAYTVAATSASNTLTYKGVWVNCPVGRKVIAAGARIVGGGGQVVINNISPNPQLASVFVSAYDDGATTAWSVKAFASCGIAPTGLTRVTAASPFNSVDKSVTATCPIGTRVLGLGGAISGGSGRVVLGAFTPKSNLTSGTVTAREGDAIPTNWQVSAYAICGPAPAGLGVYYGNSAYNSLSPKAISLRCPTGQRVISAAFALPVAGPVPNEVGISELWWDAGYSLAFFTAHEHDAWPGYWLLTAYVICAPG